ncbi:Calcium-transporting P-type ATPase, subfamily IIB [Artemisia annua]|uniref:Calcium-transporting P-type ATPase, subfamily IIB n=1 Tax=Artemisia annua TaxID=35608 RepID=A0A2U1KY24_ARTAN|nr:Calcium-transporting P-type ATPase, subfamily IIB [Artemisia annua]
MMADQAMVRKLSTCETMGSATVICTDKTGTLTMNQTKVTKFWVGLDNIEYDSLVDEKLLELYHQGVGLNTTGSVYNSGTTCEYSGSPTEKAILSWAVTNLGMDMEKLKQDSTILHVQMFNSEKK